jgi:serine phosphatase RsbU (regulator of sigma subunit)/ligand-binding sensor domain-containing protein
MRFKNIFKISGSTLVCLFLYSAILNSQTYSFKNYGSDYNIPDGFIYTINQSENGFLWVGTGKGISRFDGFKYYPVHYPDSTAGRNPTVSLKDKNGTLWFGCNDGSVFYTSGNGLQKLLFTNSMSISGMTEGPDGLIYIIPQGKSIFSVNPVVPEEIKQYNLSSDKVLHSAAFAVSGNLLIGTQENILVCSLGKDTILVRDVIEGFENSAINAIHKTKDSTKFLIGTEDNGLFLLKYQDSGNTLARFIDHPEWSTLRVKSISEDTENNFWVSTFGSGVIQFRMTDNYAGVTSVHLFNPESGLGSDDAKLVFQDAEGNFWFGLFGQGISMLTSYSFAFYSPGKNPAENNILFVSSLDDKIVLGTPTGFHLFDPDAGKSVSFTSLTGKVGGAQISSYFVDSGKNIWIGTKGKGLYLRDRSGSVNQFYRNGDSGADEINDIETDGNNIWLATINGVIVIDKSTRMERYKFDITNGLPPKSINKIFLDGKGNAYIGAESDRLFRIDSEFKVSTGNAQMYGSTINKVLSLTKSSNDEIWASTGGNGIFGFLNDSVSAINGSHGLMSPYCYSILADSEDNIWVGHDKGFSRFNPESGTVSVFGTDYIKKGVCNTDGMFESADKKIFIGTTEGLIVYDSQKDIKSTIAPYNNIISILIDDGETEVAYQYQPTIELKFKKYRITINYTGISFGSPEKVFYSTYLENYDPGFSKMSTVKEVTYSLSDGKYRFNMVSVNENGLTQDNPVSFDLIINRPWWRTWWAILTEILPISGILILIIRERDKAQKKIQEYLEKELDARTKVIMTQKGEIELQNIEITDSINYAKRIQTSILPDISKLKESFNDAFILFQPRDIVSGDFYWFDKIDDEKFVLVCADSTGHGVPGAFMSMIGSTLLQDIVSRMKITKPSEILTLLNRQIFSTLNQNAELGVSNDGMDMVVCEFNVKTRHLRFASAMRPVIIIVAGDSFYIKGNRSSVGGESVNEKYFDDQEYYLQEGDTIYLFSDGLPDQFGGPEGKKMKIARLKRIIEQVSRLPMDQQKETLSKYYIDWRGGYDQVDDILLMGVKV